MRRLLVLLVWLLPLLFLIILGERGLGVSPFLVALILFVLFLAAGALIGGGGGSRRQEESGDEQEKKGPSDERMLSLANELQPFLSVKGWKAFGGIVQFEGLLRTDPEDALIA
jgi:hypothetical protein